MNFRFLLTITALVLCTLNMSATTHTITNSGFNFVPAALNVTVGDTVVFNIGGSHNAVEVSQADYNARNSISNGGFTIPFGGGSFVVTEAKTYYYVCSPHVTLDMVGTIVATEAESQVDEVYTAQLRGSNEALPIMTTATGEVTATLSESTLVVEGSFSGLSSDFNSEIGAHLHSGYAGQNGGVEIVLVPTLNDDQRGGTFEAANNTFELTDDQLALLTSRQMYVNIHSVNFPAGELRGQVLPSADDYYYTNLFGSNEVPAVMSGGSGALALELNGDSLTVTGAFMNMEGELDLNVVGGSHLHVGLPGQNGGIEIELVATLGEDGTSGVYEAANNTFFVTEAQKNLLESRSMYANLHSTVFGSGELRGQIRKAANVAFRANFSGNNEVVPVTTAATGGALLELDGGSLVVSGAYNNLSSALNTDVVGGAHIHVGLAGQNGGVDIVLNPSADGQMTSGTFTAANNTFELDEAQIANLFARRNYVNIHSLNFPGGELRGQIVPESQFFLNGFLTGMQEADPVLSAGSGNVVAEVRGNNIFLSGSFNNLESPFDDEIGIHIHTALAGKNGPVTFPLNPDLSADMTSGELTAVHNNFELTDAELDTLRKRAMYVNVHSLDDPMGELRGQLLHEATAYFFTNLSGSSETTPVNTDAFGAVALEWNSGNVLASGSFNDLGSALNTDIIGGAHLHFGFAGQNGPVIYVLNPTTSEDNLSAEFLVNNNQLAVSESFPDTILSRQVYVNIHSLDNPGGELRGQTLPFANAYFTATANGTNEIPFTSTTGKGAFKLELYDTTLVLSGSFSDLIGDYANNIGSHLHAGIVGTTGAVEIPLVVTLNEDSRSGVYTVTDNTFELSEEQLALLNEGALYINIHTEEFNPGEIRGQVLPETNQFPGSSGIVAPESGAALTIQGSTRTPFTPTWSAATDPDMDNLAYIWQLAADPNFTALVLSAPNGQDTVLAADFGTVDALLEGAGVEVGQTITLYHRAIATDGSLSSTGMPDSVVLTRGVVVEPEVFVADLRGSNEALPIMTRATGQVTAELIDSTLTVRGEFSGLSGDFNFEVADGSHIHRGFAGQNGGIEITLIPNLDDDLRGGTFDADSNTFTLTADQMMLLRNRESYINIHTTTFPGGELRGQLLPESDEFYYTNLFGSNEVPAVMSGGSGALALELNGDSLTVTGAFMNMEGELDLNVVGGSHLHAGLPGQNGGIEIELVATLGEDGTSGVYEAANNTFFVTEAQKNLLESRSMYANLHSTVFGSGELRGQIRKAANVAFRAGLSGNNETAPVTTGATGSTLLELEGDQLTVSGAFNNLSSELDLDIAGGAHIHLGLAGQNGGVEFILASNTNSLNTSGTFASADNVFTLSDEQISNIFGRRNYVNIHSLNFGGGEIRGQVVPESQFFMNGFLTGMQEANPVQSTGAGNVIVEVRGQNVFLSGSFNNMNTALDTEIGAHLHIALAGKDGPVAYTLNPALSMDGKSGEFTASNNNFGITEAELDTLRKRAFYVNVHSLSSPSGELRSQLLHEATAYFYANLSGSSEVTPVNTEAFGAVALEWNSGNVLASGSYNNLGSALNTEIEGGAHLHFGLAGQNGPIMYLLTPTASGDNLSGEFLVGNNALSVSEMFPDTILNRQVYVNIHSLDNPGGELRGQTLPFANTYFTSTFSGINQVPFVSPAGNGAAKLELNGNILTVTGSFTDLQSDYEPNIGSHLHMGLAGQTGDVVIPLVPMLDDDLRGGVYMPDSNTYELTEEQLRMVNADSFYVNIHTVDDNPGEIRGQVLPETNQFPTASNIISPMDGATVVIEGEGETPFQATWSPAMDADDDSIAYVWQLALDPNFAAVALTVNIGSDTAFVSDFNTLDGLLASAGLGVGQSITLYHRAIALDGSLSNAGPGAAVTVERGVVTDIDDAVLEQMSVNTYPNPATDRLRVDINSVENFNANLVMVDELGRIVVNRRINLLNGENNELIEASNLSAGNYFIQVWVENELLKSTQVIIQK